MANSRKEEALETIVISELKIRKIHTMGLNGLVDYGFTEEEVELLRKIIAEEKKQPIKMRSVPRVMGSFKSQMKRQRRDLKTRASSQDIRDTRQKFQLGIPFKGMYWHSVDAGKKRYYVVCSIGTKENPDPQNAQWLFKVKSKNNFAANVILAVKIDGVGKIMSAIITVQGIPKMESGAIIQSAYKLLTSEEKERSHWIKDENKSSLICIEGSHYTYADVVGIIENCIKSICDGN